VGFWTLLLAAWGGIAVFVGPLFDYRPTSSSAWEWTMQNWLLHLVPGAVGVLAGLMMLGTMGARGAARRSGLGLASLLTIAAGAWFVIGPAAYRWFESANAFAMTGSARSDFVNQIGANLGPGVLLAILGGMALKAGIANPRVVLEHEGEAGAASAATTTAAPAGIGEDAAAAARAESARREDPATGTMPATKVAPGTPPPVSGTAGDTAMGGRGPGRSAAEET
jgi:hypothetical protein